MQTGKDKEIAYLLEAYANTISAAEEELTNASVILDDLDSEWYDHSDHTPKILHDLLNKAAYLAGKARKAAERSWQRYR